MKTSLSIGGRGLLGLLFFVSTTTLSVTAFASDGPPDRGKLNIPPAMAEAIERDMGWTPSQIETVLNSELQAAEAIARAEEELGPKYAGSWIEHNEAGIARAVVATTAPAARRGTIHLRDVAQLTANVEYRVVSNSLAELKEAVQSFNAASKNPLARALPGVHSWGIDLESNRVVVVTSPDVSDLAVDFFAKSGVDLDLIDFRFSEEEPSTLANIVGGFQYNGCSIGFAVTRGSTKGFVTAGHCGSVGTPVRINGVTVGQFQRSNFPGADAAWANVRQSDTLYNLVWVYSGSSTYSVTNSNSAPIGATVCRSGFRTGWRCGSITRNNVSVNYGSGTVYGLRESNACAGQGDSGGSWVAGGNAAQGVTSGGALGSDGTNCGIPQSQRRSWFQPLNPMLSAYGVNLVTY